MGGGITGFRRFPLVICALNVALACPLAGSVARAELSVEAHLDRDQVAVNERITLTVTISGTASGGPPELPDLPDFSVFPAGSSRNFSFVNGKMASSTVHTYILAPKREGTFEIPPIAVVDGKKRYTSRPLTVSVGGASPAPPPPEPDRGASRRRSRTRADDERAVFVTAEAEPRKPYVGQQVTLSVRFYQGVRLLERPDYVPPVATGFWVESLPDERTYYTTIDGRQYHVTELKSALFPTEAGELEIGPAQVKCVIERDPLDTDPFSNWFRGGFGTGISRTVKTKPIAITARPIPLSGRPANWSGAVGRYRIGTSLDPERVRAGEAATLTITLTGQGNIRAIGDPELEEIAGLRTFDSRAEVEDSRKGGAYGGIKRITRVLVPESSGTYTIPAIGYPVFRPDLDRFEVIESKPITLEVLEAGATGPGLSPIQGGAPNLIPTEGASLRFIRLGDPGLRRAGGRPWVKAGFWLIQLLPVVGLASAFLFARHRERVRADQGYARLRRSGSEARRRLKTARQHLEGGDPRAFYGAVAEAILGYIADRTNVPAPSLTIPDVRHLLAGREVDPGLVEQVAGCLERCDFGRFAPGTDGASRELLADAEASLHALAKAGL